MPSPLGRCFMDYCRVISERVACLILLAYLLLLGLAAAAWDGP